MKIRFVRPSDVVRAIEEGVIHIPSALREVAAAARVEYRARKIADAHMAYEASAKSADLREILDRAADLINAKDAKDAAQKAKADAAEQAWTDTLLNKKRTLRERFF